MDGFTVAKGLFTLRFTCTLKYCKSKHKFSQVVDNNFKIYHNDIPINHKEDERVGDFEEDCEVLNAFDFNKKLSKLIDLPNILPEKSNNIDNVQFKVDKDVVYDILKKKVEAVNHMDTVDFNFQFMTGVCKGWNKMDLLTYINHTFSMVSDLLSISDLNSFGIKTWLQFDIVDLRKENSSDIYKNFPELDSNTGHSIDKPPILLAPHIAKIIKPYQIGGIRFLYHNVIGNQNLSDGGGCVLAHSMGLGKTLQIVCFCDILLRHASSKTTLCIVPVNTIQNWMSEFDKWLPCDNPIQSSNEIGSRKFKVYTIADAKKTFSDRSNVIMEWKNQGGVLIMGYELFRSITLKEADKKRLDVCSATILYEK